MACDLTDKVIIITGGGSGIGAATAIACAKMDMNVVLNGRRESALQTTADAVRKIGRDAELVVGDVTEPGMSVKLLDAAEQRFGRFDVVFANAGFGFYLPMHETNDADLRRMFEVNFFAAVDLLREAANRLIKADKPGHLLMTSSALAKYTLRYYGVYTATKAAQHHVCRSMRLELKSKGIEVSSVHPVGTHTEFFGRVNEIGEKMNAPKDARKTPAWLMQQPERVADAIVKCLRKPRPEVWTSFPAKAAAAVFALFPKLMDRIS